ncbi:hypothetical protein PROFUN_02081 [Planoprotostelium fungivorum]|uniref:Aspartate aminotransferase n=1 Tax=Planoprotostelium fungivorum TaxID=1890364 RepID=A0A2P6NBD0_9EUKA|nr:hypothetical protein PROFUN_02081 [Planoprotostelium fungivorum]
MSKASLFSELPEAPLDPILGLNQQFLADPSPNKINLGVGAYRTEEGKPLILNCVKKAEEIVDNSGKFNKEYLPIDGPADFYNASQKTLFGDTVATHGDKFVSVQALSGTGALRIGMEFVKKFFPKDTTVYISDPTWPNHKNICTAAGVPWKNYRYYSRQKNALDMAGLLEDISAAPDRSIILLHVCAHNPTGMDPTPDQWNDIANLIQKKNHIPFFDCAYQGFASGDLDRDAEPLKDFVRRGFELFVAQSFAKNFGLYGERVGTLTVVTAQTQTVKALRSQLKSIIRANYSSPPAHGAYVTQVVLTDEKLLREWKEELKGMAGRILDMRVKLYEALKQRGIHWEHVMKQIGMFSYTGLNPEQVQILIQKHHIYLTGDGRISLAGLSTRTVPILADAIVDALTLTTQKL